MERREDELSRHLSCTNRVASAADGSNILECNAEARMRERDRENLWGYGTMSMPYNEQDWIYRRNYQKHFTEPGGMTFGKGDTFPDEKL